MGLPERIGDRTPTTQGSNVALSGVILLLASGVQRRIEHADSADVDGPFFIVTRWYQDLNLRETVLTLRSDDVVAAEIVEDGVKANCVLGGGALET
jgi:hypothetical protein